MINWIILNNSSVEKTRFRLEFGAIYVREGVRRTDSHIITQRRCEKDQSPTRFDTSE